MRTKQRNNFLSSTTAKVLLIVVGIVLLIAVLEATNVTHIFHKKKPIAVENTHTASQDTKGEPTNSNNPNSNSNNQGSSTPEDNKSNSGSASSNLSAPSGNFVSNHQAKISDQLESTCTTTPGATCQITFSKDNEVKSLPAMNTDKGGSAYWSWKAADIGLTTGTWQIKAVATLNGQTKTTADALNLEVSQ